MPDTKKDNPKSPAYVQQTPEPKELYLARGLSQLNSQVDDEKSRIKVAGFNSLCRVADKLWAIIGEPNKEGTHDHDQERAYILLLRYIRILRLIKKAAGDDKFVYVRFGTRLENSVSRWEYLRNTLTERYKARLKPSETSDNIAQTESINMDALIALSLEKQKDRPPMSAEPQFIAKYLSDAKSTDPKCLYLMLQDKVNVLIVDIRSRAAFENSSIKCDATVINIDGEFISKGMTANKLGQRLSAEAQAIFENRRKYELLVVVDENSFLMSHVHSMEAKIYTFLDIIGNWDIATERYPNGGPVMLQGGFAGWMDHYPTLCSNPQARFTPSGHAMDAMDTFLAVEYPTFDYDTEKKTVMVIDRSTKPIYPKLVVRKRDLDDDIPSDSDEAPYKSDENEMQFDPLSLLPVNARADDPDIVRKGLAYLAVALRMSAKLRTMQLRAIISFRAAYDVMTDDERKVIGNAQLSAYVDALEAADERVTTLYNQLMKYMSRYPFLADKRPPHGPIAERAHYVYGIWQERYDKILHEHKESIAYVRDIKKNIPKRKKSTCTMELRSSVPKIPPVVLPKVPDRTFQPAAIWLPDISDFNDSLTGLVNYHNNCYLNSTIQALRHVPTFYKYILTHEFKKGINRRKLQPNVQLVLHVAASVEDLWRCHKPTLSSERLYNAMLQTCPIFEDWRHEDGLEVFTLLFNRMCEETERPMRIQAQYDFYHSNKIDHWIRMHNRQISFLSQRFYYEIRRTRDCKSCNRKMITYDISNSMMLPFKLPNDSGGIYTPSRLNLQSAVSAYMELPDRYKIFCTKCKCMAIEYKKIKYYPEVAVINLKRYVADMATKCSISRNDTIVTYPETKLKIGIAHYRLNAIVMHRGTMDSGHYTALCLNPVDKNWYYYDDGLVRIITDIHDEYFRRKCYVFYYSLETEFQRLNLHFGKL